jgi:hypothetical protein
MTMRQMSDAGDEGQALVRAALQQRFPENDLLQPGELAFSPGEELRAITPDPALATQLPAWQFFQTRLTTSYEEYAFVQIIAAVENGNPRAVSILLAPDFDPRAAEFLSLFHGLTAEPGNDREQLSRSIARFLALVTHEGSLTLREQREDRVVFDLCRQNVRQNRLVFTFDEHGKLFRIVLEPA